MNKVIGIVLGVIGVAAAALSIMIRTKGNASISIIGGADGPTSIFLAGKVGGASSTITIIIGIIFVVIGVMAFTRRKK